MAKQNGAQTVKEVEGRRVIISAGVGKTNADELLWLTDTVLAAGKALQTPKQTPVPVTGCGNFVKMPS